MVNRINIFQPDAPMSYDDRIKILKERKLEETRVKSTMKVYQDGDDYGSIPAPETYQFHCIPNHENGSWYGYDGWSKNFYKLMTEHPVYIDPVDAFTCRWMFSMIWFDEKSPDKGLNWNPNFFPTMISSRNRNCMALSPGSARTRTSAATTGSG